VPTLTTDLCIGSYPSLPEQSISTTANAVTEAFILPARSYYLTEASPSSFDLLYRLGTNSVGLAELPLGLSFTLQRDLRVRVTSLDAVAFTLTWPTDGVLRDLLGFTGNLSPAAVTHTATNISPLIWSAGRTASYSARLDTDGTPVHDTAIGQAATGVISSTSHNTYRENSIIWRYVTNARVWTTAEAGGELYAFWDRVLRRSARFKVYRQTVEDSASTTAITLGSTVLPSAASSTAYVHVPSLPVRFPYSREFGFVESLHPITLDVVTTPEYT
jgi:hypothetical protein